jgi:Rrf2 family iron-sulfur cluster assembly transcriptional regulator
MKLSTKGRYAVTAMMDLALHEGRAPVTLAEISRCQGISLSYLEQLFARLRRYGLVNGVRGPGGGYRLARGAGEISIADVIVAVDENADAAGTVAAPDGLNEHQCLTRELWGELSSRMFVFLDGITLEQLVHRPGTRPADGVHF